MNAMKIKPLRSALALALAAVAMCAPLGNAMAFEGQKAAPPVKTGAQPASVMAPVGAQSTANAPNGNQIQTAGIRSDQLAADQSSLDKMMYAAIEASNPDEVRNLLKAGVNLRQDFNFACDHYAFFENHPAEAKFFDLRVSDKIRLASVPGHCTKQHLMHALFRAIGVYPGPDHLSKDGSVKDSHDGFWLALLEDKLGPVAQNPFIIGENKQMTVSAIDSGKRAFEVLALIDANIPVADKAFYLSYLTRALAYAPGKNTIVIEWTIQKYEQALPEIKRARAMREPGRLAWDQYKARRIASGIVEPGGVLPSMTPMFDPSVTPGGDDRMAWKSFSTGVLMAYDNSSGVGRTCSMASDIERRPNAASARQLQMAELYKNHMSDYVDRYTLDGLSKHTFGSFSQDALKVLKPNMNDALAWRDAMSYFSSHHMIATLLSKPEAISALGNEQSLPLDVAPPFHMLAGLEGSELGRASPGLMRAMLNAGVNPGTRDANGKTPADLVIGSTPYSMWRAQAFTKKDLIDGGCKPRG